MSFFSELKRRNVFKVAAAYVIVGWLIMQVGDVMAPAMHLPDWINSALAFFLVLGFPVALVLSWAFELTPDGIRLEKNVERSNSITHLTGRKLDYWIIALLFMAVGFFAFDKFVLDPERDAVRLEAAVQDARQDSAGAVDPSPGLSIAVLPFVNMSADESNEFFSDGISEELLNVLARLPGLRVAARTSAFQFKGLNRDISEIASQLRVGHVLEGSVRKSGSRLRITAQLIEAETGFHLWSESYDRELEDIFAIQDEIAGAIVDALKIELALGDAARPGDLPSVPAAASAQAYEYYLRGRQLINGRSPSGLEEAVVALERALELDETYAPAHAQLAIAIALLRRGSGTYGSLSMEEILQRAAPHVERAFELDPNLSEAFGARTLLANINFDYARAIDDSRMAMSLNPSYVDVMNWRYLTLLNTGHWREARRLIDQLLAVDPLSIVGRLNYAYMLGRMGRFGEAHQLADELGTQSVRARFLTHALISGDYQGQVADSTRQYLEALALDPDDTFTLYRIAINLSVIGLYDEARRLSPKSQWLISAYQQRWPDAIAAARQTLEQDPQNSAAKLALADVLHMSGDVAGAQVLYDELRLQNPGFVIIDPNNTSTMPTARMAYGSKAEGNDEGAKSALELLRTDQRARQAVGIEESYVLRGAAMAAAIAGDADGLVTNLAAAIDHGLRDHFIFREPAMQAYFDHPGFRAQAARLDGILENERRKTLQMICIENPAPEVWQPLPETCSDV